MISNNLTIESIISFLSKNKNNRFCICDYSDNNHNNYEIIYRIINNTILRKKWDTDNWEKTKFLKSNKEKLEYDIEKGKKFDKSKNPNKYTKVYTYNN